MIGECLKYVFVGNDVWIFFYCEECFDQIGLKLSVKIFLFNGFLECEFCKYQIFDGKYKEFKSQEGGDENGECVLKERREFKLCWEEGGFRGERRLCEECNLEYGDRRLREFKGNCEFKIKKFQED